MSYVRFTERYAGWMLAAIVIFVGLCDPPSWFYAAMIPVLGGGMFAHHRYYRMHLYRIKRAVELWSPLASSPYSYAGHPMINVPDVKDTEILQAVLCGDVPLTEPVMALLAVVTGNDPKTFKPGPSYWREWGKERGYHPNALQFA